MFIYQEHCSSCGLNDADFSNELPVYGTSRTCIECQKALKASMKNDELRRLSELSFSERIARLEEIEYDRKNS